MSPVISSFLLMLLINPVYGDIHIIELMDERAERINDSFHGNHVLWVACQGKPGCTIEYFTETLDIEGPPKGTYVTNMSFSQQLRSEPNFNPYFGDEKYEEDMDEFEREKSEFERDKKFYVQLIESNPEILFTISSGNGMRVEGFQSYGVPVGTFVTLYPATINTDNTLKVSAINSATLDFAKLDTYQLAEYANFSLDYVDIASVSEVNQEGDFVKGTSFAAPAVARIANELRTLEPSLNPLTTKKILMRSCYVPKIDKAIEGTQDIIRNGRNSKVFWAQNHHKRVRRLELFNEIGGFMLVKCGGFLIPDVARKCLSYYQQEIPMDDACLKAQKEILNVNNTDKLKTLWMLRGI